MRLFETYFEVPLIPTAKGRAKAFVLAGRPKFYTPAKTREAEANFIAFASTFAPSAPLPGPVIVDLEFVFPIPRSWPAWQQEAAAVGAIEHTSKPDGDNLEKLALDALTASGRWWRDDAQVVRKTTGKSYGPAPATKVRVREIAEVQSAAEWKALREKPDLWAHGRVSEAT